MVQLANGCLCCTVKSDLIDTFRDLQIQRNAGTIPYFDRVIIEKRNNFRPDMRP